ncbi:MAG: hypothetical protein E7569_02730 [Ruminococcaceae bacterium]|nr:hypothetical protein [Oscillospiraceae bacterium]
MAKIFNGKVWEKGKNKQDAYGSPDLSPKDEQKGKRKYLPYGNSTYASPKSSEIQSLQCHQNKAGRKRRAAEGQGSMG